MEEKNALDAFLPIQEKQLRIAAKMNKGIVISLCSIGSGYAICTSGTQETAGFVLVAHASKKPRVFRSADTGIELIKSFSSAISSINITFTNEG